MNAHFKVDKAAFAKFVLAQPEGRFEYVRGQIVQQMTGGTLRHTVIAERFRDAFLRQLDEVAWLVTSQGRGVETAETVLHPDVVVEPAGADLSGLWTDKPVVIVEVLSPSTEKLDLNVKPGEYMRLKSLLAYIVASQDEPQCALWLRRRKRGFGARPRQIKGGQQKFEIEPLGIEIKMAEIYRGIGA